MIKINGIELTKQEELVYHKNRDKELNRIVKTGDYRDGHNALHTLSIVNKQIRSLELEFKIDSLYESLYKTRNNYDYDRINRRIEKLRKIKSELDN